MHVSPLECLRCGRAAPDAVPGARCPADGAPLVAAAARAGFADDALLGTELTPGLVLFDVLSDAGGFGRVYVGVQQALGRRVAVKVLRPEASPDARTRFLQEARLLARLTHEPRVATVHDCAEGPAGRLFMVQALAPGRPLAELPLPLAPSRARALLAEVLAALAAAHAEGLVHRDLKPQHVIVHGEPPSEGVTLIDFGIAKALDDPAALQTASDVYLGTPRYMAPEQLQAGGRLGPWTDVYAAGVLLFEVLTGETPFAGGAAEVVAAHLYAPPPSLPAGLPADLAAVVARALAKDPAARFADAAAMAAALGEPPAQRPPVVAETLDAASIPPRVAPRLPALWPFAVLATGIALGALFLFLISRLPDSTPVAAAAPGAARADVAVPVDAAVDAARPAPPDASLPDASLPDAARPDADRPGADLPDPARPRAPRPPRRAAPVPSTPVPSAPVPSAPAPAGLAAPPARPPPRPAGGHRRCAAGVPLRRRPPLATGRGGDGGPRRAGPGRGPVPATAGGAGVRLSRTLMVGALLAGPARAQPAAWATYRAASTAAEAGQHAAALPGFRATLAAATEPALRQAACFGLGVTARALMDAAADRAVACEGAQAFRCFLAQDAAADARQVAVDGAAALDAACAAPPPTPWVAAGGGVAAVAGGTALVALAFSDAAEVRARGRRGTAELEGRATAELAAGYVLLGAGAALLGLAAWQRWGAVEVAPSTPRAWAWEAGFEHHRRHRRDSPGRHRPGRSALRAPEPGRPGRPGQRPRPARGDDGPARPRRPGARRLRSGGRPALQLLLEDQGFPPSTRASSRRARAGSSRTPGPATAPSSMARRSRARPSGMARSSRWAAPSCSSAPPWRCPRRPGRRGRGRPARPAPPLAHGPRPLAARYRDLARLAPSGLSVLVTGETGAGKERVAEGLHALSGRGGAFVAVNCATLGPELADSALFGHQRGAFTGAAEARAGLFRRADGGTLFLDEVGELPLPVQARLLRVLETGEVQPVGADRPTTVDVRVVAATLQALDPAEFRPDLLGRLAQVQVHVPALRERREDLGLLLRALLPTPRPTMTREAALALLLAPWPRGIRQLKNALAVAHALADGVLGPEHLPADRGAPPPAAEPLDAEAEARKQALIDALTRTGGNVSEVARLLGLSRNAIHRWLNRFELDAAAFRGRD
ncbi:MAG: sigma 54-interacting transcriptional regulator [bacterium]